jgi:hypothetical protein
MVKSTKPKPFVMDSDVGFTELESALSPTWSTSGPGHDLLLATNLKIDSRPGGSAAAAQLIISWSRQNANNKLVTHIKDTQDELAIRTFISRLHGLIAVAMAPQIVTRNSEGRLDTDLYKRAYDDLLEKSNAYRYNFRRGPELGLLSIDHWPELAFPKQLYNVTDSSIEVKSQASFGDLALDLLSATGTTQHKLVAGTSALGQMLFELFTNTHAHARTNERDERYPRSVRGIIVAHRQIPLASLASFSGGMPALACYLDALQRFVPGGTLNVAEFSLFDSGPGYVRRMSPGVRLEDLSVKSEYEIVRRCFLKNISSTAHRGHGKGLTRVLQILKERGGLIRLRTGRLSLFQYFDLPKEPRFDKIRDGDIRLRDSETLTEEPVLKACAEGATVTVLIPMGIR